jgi:hypothetical protein
VDHQTVLEIVRECQALARLLADRQEDDSSLTPKLCTRLVNALLNSGNTLEYLASQAKLEATHGPDPGTPGPEPAVEGS